MQYNDPHKNLRYNDVCTRQEEEKKVIEYWREEEEEEKKKRLNRIKSRYYSDAYIIYI